MRRNRNINLFKFRHALGNMLSREDNTSGHFLFQTLIICHRLFQNKVKKRLSSLGRTLIGAKTIQNLHWDERKGDRSRVLGVDG